MFSFRTKFLIFSQIWYYSPSKQSGLITQTLCSQQSFYWLELLPGRVTTVPRESKAAKTRLRAQVSFLQTKLKRRIQTGEDTICSRGNKSDGSDTLLREQVEQESRVLSESGSKESCFYTHITSFQFIIKILTK
ncbi:hypothetical protein CRENBAI_021783 [Crenichthys baileyi]|uniref:Uncharacterized protein n=1 Tax=Crenichthys baileyi TaxID=28760 RepID=A0AAV9SNF7_9TELE